MSEEMNPDSIISTSKKPLSEVLDIAITVLSLVMVIYHLVYAYALFINVYMHQNMHLMLALVIIMLSEIKKEIDSNHSPRRKRIACIYLIIILVASIIGCIYVFTQGMSIQGWSQYADRHYHGDADYHCSAGWLPPFRWLGAGDNGDGVHCLHSWRTSATG